ncbi:MAG: HAD-IA family hydrolase [Clostridiales Family XIII bacterium]|jgi:pyrophosphatase PpaX|nr:HAD-IA family hydrolase [Clostridiales Family XIII bacterium]
MRVNTVLFDFDGTVMDTNGVIIDSWQHTFRTLTGAERPVEDIVATFGEILHDTAARFFPHVPVEESVEIYRSYHRNNFGPRISVFPGVRELLAALKARGYALAIVTSRLPATTMEGLEKYGLTDYFDLIVTCEDCTKFKPDPEPVRIALAKLGKKPEEALMVGDTRNDILCARGAGVKSVLVGWAVAVPEGERSGPDAPDYRIEKAGDLLDILAAASETDGAPAR